MTVAESIANWSFLLIAALLVDLALGGRRLLGRLPGPDHLLYGLVSAIAARLDRPGRGDGTNMARGLLMIAVLAPALAGLGHLVDRVAFDGRIGSLLALVLLVLTIGQRAVWDLTRAIGKALGDGTQRADENRYGAARWALERLVLRFADGLVVNAVILMIGGFTLLLPFRLIAVTVSTGAPSGLLRPKGAFQRGAVILHEIAALPGTLIAGLVVATAQFFAPHGSARTFRGFAPGKGPYLMSRALPMGVLAYGLGLNFKSDTDLRDDAALWFGPADGRARLGPADIRRCQLVAIAATLIAFLLLIALLAGALHVSS